MTMYGSSIRLIAAALLVGGCTVSDADNKQADTAATATTGAAPAAAAPTTTPAQDSAAMATATPGATSTSATQPTSALRVEVDVSARKLYLVENGQRIETHGVAVGSAKWPTQKGEWTIKQVVFNPEWTPPDESWAEEREPRKPGDPKNPLGVAQLVYDPPRTIHGTNQPTSIGTATSHGSIRMKNEEIVALGKRLLSATGAGKDEAWYQRAATNRTEKQIVDLPQPVPIKVF
jgi:lipoprotein-anchoring transpeptidase ErfK/SrfK